PHCGRVYVRLPGFVRLGRVVEVPFSVQEVDIYDRAVKGETVEICGPALPDLVAGQVQVMFDPVPSSIAHIRAGKLRPLTVPGDRVLGKPITGIAACCARAASGHAAAPPPTSMMNSRRCS